MNLISRIYKEPQKLNHKKTNNPESFEARDSQRHFFPRRETTGHEPVKRCYVVREMKIKSWDTTSHSLGWLKREKMENKCWWGLGIGSSHITEGMCGPAATQKTIIRAGLTARALVSRVQGSGFYPQHQKEKKIRKESDTWNGFLTHTVSPLLEPKTGIQPKSSVFVVLWT